MTIRILFTFITLCIAISFAVPTFFILVGLLQLAGLIR